MRMKTIDLPVDDLLVSEEEAEQIIQSQQQLQERAAQAQDELLAAQTEEALSNAMKNEATARKTDGSLSVEAFEAIMGVMEAASKARAEAHKAAAAKVAAGASVLAATRPQPAKASK